MKHIKSRFMVFLLLAGLLWSGCENPAGRGSGEKAPGPPPGIALTGADGQLTVSWEAVEGAAAYEVWYGENSGGEGRRQSGGDVTRSARTMAQVSAAITGLSNGTTYYVWVRSKNSAGAGAFSPPASGTPRPGLSPPENPGRAPAIEAGDGRLTAQWEALEGAAAYEVWYGADSGGLNRRQSGGDVSRTALSISGLANDTTYYVWVRGKNSAGTGGFSPPGSGTPRLAANPPAAPSAPALTSGEGLLAVSWEAVAGASAYEVWYGTDSGGGNRQKFGGDLSGTSAAITGLANEAYYVWVRGKNSAGAGEFSPSSRGTPQGGGGPGWDDLIGVEYLYLQQGTGSVGSGEPAAAFSFPDSGGPWSLELVSGPGSAHNSRFRIEGNRVVIAQALDFGDFYVRVKVQGASYSAFKQLIFRVLQTPQEFDKPPLAGAVMTGLNTYKLAVSWPRRTAAEGYRVYIGKTQDSGAAVQAGGDYGGAALSAEISSYPGEGPGLPCGAEYYVWVNAFNGQGETQFSPAAARRTGDPVPDPVWGTWKSQFKEAYDLERAELKLSYGFISDDGENWGFWGTMVYHKDFGTQTRPSVGTGLGSVTGGAGVLIFKFGEGSSDYGTGSDYYAVYYWGLGAVSPPGNYSEGSKLLHMANAWQVKPSTAKPPATFTPGEAEDLFTEANQDRFIGWNIVWPQYLYRGEGAFAGTSFTELASWLGSQPENTSATPYYASVSGVNLKGLTSSSNSDPWGWFFDKIKARFVSLNIDACTGATVGWVTSQMGDGSGNPDRQKIVSVKLPSVAERVSRFLFNGCVNLKSVTFPGGLLTIGGRAFKDCAALTRVDIPASVHRIDQEAFLGCAGLTSVTIRAAVPPLAKDDSTVSTEVTGTMAEYSVFSGCSSAVFYVPANSVNAYVTALGVSAGRVKAIQ
jgi:hypothetical protein